MKRFILRTLFFLFLATALMAALDACLSYQLRQRQFGPYACWTDIFHSRIHADLIIMGSSRSYVQYDPAILDSVLHTHSYNLGFNGSAFNRQYTRYLLYRKYNPKPRIIIQNIDFSNLTYTSGFDQYQYFPYFCDPDIRHQVLPYEKFTFADKTLPFYRYANYGLQNIFKDLSVSVNGYSYREKHWHTQPFKPKDLAGYTTDPRTLASFERFLADATAEGIQVILVHAPIHTSLTSQQQGLNQMWRTYHQLADKYHLPILNYQNDSISFDTLYFYNRTHLNRQGSEIFSRHLAEDLKNLLQQQQ